MTNVDVEQIIVLQIIEQIIEVYRCLLLQH